MTQPLQKPDSLCWIHLKNMRFFTKVGAFDFEKEMGQCLEVHLSIQIKYENTLDNLSETLDYGKVYKFLENKFLELNRAKLIEYLAEQILTDLGKEFTEIKAAKLYIEKKHLPIPQFLGQVAIEAARKY